ncbi:2OG-Fe(II) oxygenase [Legionella sp. W05-934-2]|jgi:SM-20-related protein|uniref:2OG-Fe(II) oxygenase n=1 Tax=Legionella sp. W05-934-2 TaxID=1198649 RepID=UPI003461E368
MALSPEFLASLCHDEFAFIDNFLPKKQYQAICQMAQQLFDDKQFKPSGIGRTQRHHTNSAIRRDEIYWLDPSQPLFPAKIILSALDNLMHQLNESIFLSLVEFEAHLAIYQPGSYYRKHSDQFQDNDTRQISCVYYLNHDWQEQDGGQLVLFDQDDHVKIRLMPQGNRLVCFKSHLMHEVEETKKQRASVTVWMKRRSQSLIA